MYVNTSKACHEKCLPRSLRHLRAPTPGGGGGAPGGGGGAPGGGGGGGAAAGGGGGGGGAGAAAADGLDGTLTGLLFAEPTVSHSQSKYVYLTYKTPSQTESYIPVHVV